MNTHLFVWVFTLFIITAGCGKNKSNAQSSSSTDRKVGGGCEGCEAIFESPVPFHLLNWVDTLPGFDEPGPKLEITGTVYKKDGKTPAPNIILYIYHTDQTGHYTPATNATGWGKRHGRLRGWIKTNDKGQYKFYTLKPVAYPNAKEPAHIHPTIKEPGLSEYYIDAYVFDDDPLLTEDIKRRHEGRGGDGILKLQQNGTLFTAKRDIILGKNIPDY